jgi:hypothetical protein
MAAARGRSLPHPRPTALTQSERIADLKWRLWWVTRERLPVDVVAEARTALDAALTWTTP